mgnify:CR=1 FL=1
MTLKTILNLLSLTYIAYALYLVHNEQWMWFGVWIVSSKVLSLTVKQDILAVITKGRGE